MPRITQSDRAGMWDRRCTRANKIYDEWADTFKTNTLEDYYAGLQWKNRGGGDDKYTINLMFPTVEVKIPSLMFNRPRAHFRLKPQRADDIGSHLDLRAKLFEDVANHFMALPRAGFAHETKMTVKESLYRFGITEVGYSANFADNPNAGRPILDEGGDLLKDSMGQAVMPPDYIIEDELIYIRRIPAKNFRVAITNSERLERADWVAYYEWMWIRDIKRNRFFKNRNKIRANGAINPAYDPHVDPFEDEDGEREGMVKVWKIWDNRLKVRHVKPDGANYFLIEDEPFRELPFADIKFHDLLDQFYPVPFLFNLISPQDELNESRDMQRIHRRRFARRYEIRRGAVDEDELQKLEGPAIDGQYLWVNQSGAIAPIPDAPLDRAVTFSIPATKEDFMQISATGGEARGQAESDTATQASIIDSHLRVRDSFSRQAVAEYLSKVIRLIVIQARENLTLPWYMKTMVDPTALGAQQEAAMVGQMWQEVKAQDIGDFDFEVEIEVESLAPESEDKRRDQWNTVLSMIGSPNLQIMFLTSETLLRKTLGFYGVKSDREIQDIKNSIQMQMQMMMMQTMGGPPAKGKDSGPGADPGTQAKNAAAARAEPGR